MSDIDDVSLTDALRRCSRELCPDYPGIEKDLSNWEHLWAITASLEGTRLANDDMHAFTAFLTQQLGWTALEAVEKYKEHKQKESEHGHAQQIV